MLPFQHVNDLLDLSRLEARKALCEYTEVRDFSNYLKRLSSNFEVLAADRGITYDVIESLPFKVHCDVDKMEKIFLNLLSNAFKFTPNHGHIVVEVTHDEPATDKPRGLIRISVRDSGPGVPEKIRTKIFERFQQGDEGKTEEASGANLKANLNIGRIVQEIWWYWLRLGNCQRFYRTSPRNDRRARFFFGRCRIHRRIPTVRL
jgi:signal transduction histidine kinase